MVALQEETPTSTEVQPNRRGPFTLVPVLPSTNNRYNQPVYVTADNKAPIQKVQLIPPWARVAPELQSSTPGLLLVPTLPSSVSRYDRPINPRNGPPPDVLPPNTRLPLKSAPIGEGWREHVSPEGDTYFHHEQHHIVTNTNVRFPSAEQKLLKAYDLLIELGREKDPQIVEREVYIHIVTDTPAASQVEYYFVDEVARHPFWVHSVRMRDLGLPGFETLDHLRGALTPEFWTHREYFPDHRGLDKSSENELIDIFRYGCADDMTSFGSTFPYSTRECRDHLQSLEGFAGSDKPSGYRTATFARLWASVTRVRHINGYSLPSPQLDRNQGLGEFKDGQRPNFALCALDFLLFTLPRVKFDRITELWNGRVVFQRHWHNYFGEYTRRTKPGKNRMAEIGFPWNLFHRNQPEPLQGHTQSINHQHQNGSPVAFVARRRQDQPDWTLLIQTLIDPLAISVAYSILLIGVEGYLEPERALNALFFLASLATLTATMFLLVFYPGLHTEGHALFSDRAGVALGRNWMLTSFLTFDALAYGWLLNALCRCLNTPEHHFSMPGLVLVTTVLGLPPAFHVLRMNNEIE